MAGITLCRYISQRGLLLLFEKKKKKEHHFQQLLYDYFLPEWEDAEKGKKSLNIGSDTNVVVIC